MIFSEPMPFKEAVESRLAKMLLPTELRSKLLKVLPAEIKERCFWASAVQRADEVGKISEAIDEMLAGEATRDEQRSKLKAIIDELGAPELTDARLNLILDTNLQMAEGYGSFTQGQAPVILDMYPAQELIRIDVKRVPRDWESRWEEAGGEIVDGRMVAAKDDPIWNALGDPSLFDDGLGNPYPPFAFSSGMGVADVDREEAERLGVIDPDQRVEPQDRELNQDLQSDLGIRDGVLRNAVVDFLQGVARFKDGVLVFRGGAA
jgi:hypothetical protein